MTPSDQLAHELYSDYLESRGLTPLPWEELRDTERFVWRVFAERVTARFNLHLPPRRTRTVVVKERAA